MSFAELYFLHRNGSNFYAYQSNKSYVFSSKGKLLRVIETQIELSATETPRQYSVVYFDSRYFGFLDNQSFLLSYEQIQSVNSCVSRPFGVCFFNSVIVNAQKNPLFKTSQIASFGNFLLALENRVLTQYKNSLKRLNQQFQFPLDSSDSCLEMVTQFNQYLVLKDKISVYLVEVQRDYFRVSTTDDPSELFLDGQVFGDYIRLNMLADPILLSTAIKDLFAVKFEGISNQHFEKINREHQNSVLTPMRTFRKDVFQIQIMEESDQ
ncbi:hypothetical protein SS50377_24901 [Spironucleus salmonicida]|uniref:Uncharacterized protein n=1 Tax=Spironucleus salmonicida TaxID=348837 RepID=V6LGK1_9EUKA|nr:hypothetical protein SS50377_24901 [Spironucleus salmonicida]|eukprot:EST43433.1 Hypothetical protein SS50377_16795 [Spironucleus salmonicida]